MVTIIMVTIIMVTIIMVTIITQINVELTYASHGFVDANLGNRQLMLASSIQPGQHGHDLVPVVLLDVHHVQYDVHTKVEVLQFREGAGSFDAVPRFPHTVCCHRALIQQQLRTQRRRDN